MGVLDIFHSLAGFLPEIKAPEKPLGSKEKLMWTGLALVLYFLMYQTTAFGVPQITGGIDFLQTITASRTGSILTTGIGPIVLESQDVFDFGAAKTINRLVIVSDDAEIAMPLRERFDDPILGAVGVLIFINQ